MGLCNRWVDYRHPIEFAIFESEHVLFSYEDLVDRLEILQKVIEYELEQAGGATTPATMILDNAFLYFMSWKNLFAIRGFNFLFL